jgi:hypothetical protein
LHGFTAAEGAVDEAALNISGATAKEIKRRLEKFGII